MKDLQNIKTKSKWQKNVKAKLLAEQKLARETLLTERRERARKAREAFVIKSQLKQANKEKQILGAGKGRATQSEASPMPSSWVDSLGYDEPTMTLKATLNGKDYFWRPVAKSVFLLWESGLATCRTNDHSGKKRWYKGKNPSLGAMWWRSVKKHLVGKRVS